MRKMSTTHSAELAASEGPPGGQTKGRRHIPVLSDVVIPAPAEQPAARRNTNERTPNSGKHPDAVTLGPARVDQLRNGSRAEKIKSALHVGPPRDQNSKRVDVGNRI